MMDGFVRIFDTTLRDGEQSPGASLTPFEKVQAAQQLDRLGVDVIEAGFPAASPGDLASVELVSGCVVNAQVAALARCTQPDIDAAVHALRDAKNPVLHVFMPTSDIHLEHKLNLRREEVLEQVGLQVAYARERCEHVEFSAEDATRSDWDYLIEVCRAAIEAGAETVNLPDTVGFVLPHEYVALLEHVQERLAGSDVVWSAHCHDDLGFATANTIAAIQAGCRQVEVTINGLGERAGNAPLEEVVMTLKTRGASLNLPDTAINTRDLVATSQLVSRLTGLQVQANKSIVGANAFAHEAGIHQDGVIKERTTYEIMLPADVGWGDTKFVLGKHSGRHGVAHRLGQLGYELTREDVEEIYIRFLAAADKHKVVDDQMLTLLANGHRVIDDETESTNSVADQGGKRGYPALRHHIA